MQDEGTHRRRSRGSSHENSARGYLTEGRSESSESLRESLPEAVGGALSLDRGPYPYSAERLRLGVLHVDLGPMSRRNLIAARMEVATLSQGER